MHDPVTSAKTARELLSRALAALQSDPAVPPHLLALAEPVSQAMSALFQIERSAGGSVGTHGPAALEAVRRSLALLQQQEVAHPAVGAALECVAKSLSLVHSLASAEPPQGGPYPGQPPQGGPYPGQPPQGGPYPGQSPQGGPYPGQSPQGGPYPGQSPQGGPYPGQAAPPTPRSPGAQPPPAPPYDRAPAAVAPAVVQDPYSPARYGASAGPQGAVLAAPPGAPQQPPVGVVDPSRAVRIDASLGAHSNSNFYKGLSGNDVIEHGGIFVATYRVPSVGTQVALRISLPGGYEFDALGIVRWVREPSAGDEPGFGAQLLQLTPEARQLVYRYVRNREPLFHDDD